MDSAAAGEDATSAGLEPAGIRCSYCAATEGISLPGPDGCNASKHCAPRTLHWKLMLWVAGGVLVLLAVVVIYDLTQTHHAILRNFPIIGHFRYILEGVGPELRQYIVTDNDSERPFSRDQRRWVYASSKQENNY